MFVLRLKEQKERAAVVDERTQLVADGYDRIAERYEQWGSGVGGVKQKYVDRYRSLLPRGSLVLDLGCGTGSQVTRALAADHRVVGVDVSPRSTAGLRAAPDQRGGWMPGPSMSWRMRIFMWSMSR